MQLVVADARAMERLGAAVAECARAAVVVFLSGDLGAGKTTLVRGFLRRRGHEGVVKSPTFTVVEPYALGTGPAYHLDLYRINDPEELELIGVRDYFADGATCLVEWPERGGCLLPAADVAVRIGIDGRQRQVRIEAGTASGAGGVDCLARVWPTPSTP